MNKTVTKVKKDEHVGRYKLGELISDKGGFGLVYKTVHSELQEECAIKVFRNDKVDGEQMLLLRRESIKMAELRKHKNIVQELDAGLDAGEDKQKDKYFIVMELMDGSLGDWVGKLPLEQAEWVFREVAEGLKHIHDNEYVHQDIKPSNILLRYDAEGKIREAKIADFGLAISLNTEGSSFLIGGTKGFQAPEVVQGGNPTQASDIYSLGSTFYHVLTGKTSDDFEQSTPPSKLRKGVPKKLDKLILSMLERRG